MADVDALNKSDTDSNVASAVDIFNSCAAAFRGSLNDSELAQIIGSSGCGGYVPGTRTTIQSAQG